MRRKVLAWIVLFGCSENGLVAKDENDGIGEDGEPDIEVTPSVINFGAVDAVSGDAVVETVTVRNVGTALLTVSNLEIEDPGVPFTLSTIGSSALQPGDETTFTVTYDPVASGITSTRALVTSNDPDEPISPVELTGSGIAPSIQIDPTSYDFGTLYVGCIASVPLRISNIGTADLIVSSLDFTPAEAAELSLNPEADPDLALPWTVAAGASVVVNIDYEPIDEYTDDGLLSVGSNDPEHPVSTATQTAVGALRGENIDRFDQPILGQTDIVFTLDWSGSMAEDIASVQANFNIFITTLAEMDSDYHVAVVVRDDGCTLGDNFVDNTMTPEDQISGFNRMVGSAADAGGQTEMGYSILEEALTDDALHGGCNDDMIRDDGTLALVGVTDEVEQSPHSYDWYVSLFQSMKSNPDDVVIHAIAGDYPTGCGATAEPGVGWYEGTVATGGLFLSICSPDWASSLEALAAGSAADLSGFELTQEPVPSTIRVKVNGAPAATGWSYVVSDDRFMVVFDADQVPAGGSNIEVQYALAGDCDQ